MLEPLPKEAKNAALSFAMCLASMIGAILSYITYLHKGGGFYFLGSIYAGICSFALAYFFVLELLGCIKHTTSKRARKEH